MRGFILRFLTLVSLLSFAAPAQSEFYSGSRVAYYFVTAVPTKLGCSINDFFILNPFITDRYLTSQPQILDLNIRGQLFFKTRDSKRFIQTRSSVPRGAQLSGYMEFYSIPCDEFDYLEITEAVCSLHWLNAGGGIEDMTVQKFDLCLGELPLRIDIIGTFDPDDPTMLLPIGPQIPDE